MEYASELTCSTILSSTGAIEDPSCSIQAAGKRMSAREKGKEARVEVKQ
jgi:hypothetical protein